MATPPKRLFTLRLWRAVPDDAAPLLEWRGKLQSLPDGEAYYFRGWPSLIGRLEALLDTTHAETTSSESLEGVTHMSSDSTQWTKSFLHLLALAATLEGEGQYNLAKLARAAADSMSRRAAYQVIIPTVKDELVASIERAADELPNLGMDKSLSDALVRGASALSEGRVPLIGETPHPYVCRTCGHLTLAEPAAPCPTCGAWPSTYQRFMPVYWLDALEPFAALAKLRQTPVAVAALLAGLPEEIMARPPQDGGWAIRNVVTHLRDAQGVLDYRLDLFREAEHPILESKAVWSWATNEAERPSATLEIFETYKASRAETLRKLDEIPLADWWRTGQHQEFGVVTLRQQVSYFAAHEITHLSQIEALRRRWAGGEP